MKKNWIYFTALLIFSLSAVCCSSDDDDEGGKAQNENGRPSQIIHKAANGATEVIGFRYSGKKLTEITTGAYNFTTFKYDGNNPSEVHIGHTDPAMVDGTATLTFSKSGNRITVSTIAEPEDGVTVKEIETNASGMATKITDMGYYQYDYVSGKLEKVRDGENYRILTYDSATGSLLKEDTYKLDETWVSSYTFRYDRKPGMTCNVEMPVWYRVYCVMMQDSHMWYLLNYTENLRTVTLETEESGVRVVEEFTYDYNTDDFPAVISSGNETFTVSY